MDHLSIASASVTEGNAGTGNIAFTLRYTGPSNNLSVEWATSDGTAIAGAELRLGAVYANLVANGADYFEVYEAMRSRTLRMATVV